MTAWSSASSSSSSSSVWSAPERAAAEHWERKEQPDSVALYKTLNIQHTHTALNTQHAESTIHNIKHTEGQLWATSVWCHHRENVPIRAESSANRELIYTQSIVVSLRTWTTRRSALNVQSEDWLNSYRTKFWHHTHSFEPSTRANYATKLITSPPSFQIHQHPSHIGYKARQAFCL